VLVLEERESLGRTRARLSGVKKMETTVEQKATVAITKAERRRARGALSGAAWEFVVAAVWLQEAGSDDDREYVAGELDWLREQLPLL
jgi:hypothetical protein